MSTPSANSVSSQMRQIVEEPPAGGVKQDVEEPPAGGAKQDVEDHVALFMQCEGGKAGIVEAS